MPLKITVGAGRKHGLSEYVSVSANCHTEFEADPSFLNRGLEGFHRQLRKVEFSDLMYVDVNSGTLCEFVRSSNHVDLSCQAAIQVADNQIFTEYRYS